MNYDAQKELIESRGWYWSRQNTWRKTHPDPIEMPYEARDVRDAYDYEMRINNEL